MIEKLERTLQLNLITTRIGRSLYNSRDVET
jgi:hypothetical protein